MRKILHHNAVPDQVAVRKFDTLGLSGGSTCVYEGCEVVSGGRRLVDIVVIEARRAIESFLKGVRRGMVVLVEAQDVLDNAICCSERVFQQILA